MMTAQLVTSIAAVIREITDLGSFYTVLVCTLVLSVKVAGLLFASAKGHIVFVTAIAAIVDAIANLVAGNAPMIGTLEAAQCVTVKVTADFGILIAAITTVISAVTKIGQRDA